MKYTKSNWSKAIATGAVSIGFVQALSAATILTGTGLVNGSGLVPTHGSNEAGTADIALAWSTDDGSGSVPSGGGSLLWDSYNGWPNGAADGAYQVDGTSDGSLTHSILFTANAGFNVILQSLDGLDYAGGGGATGFTWTITGSTSGVLGTAAVSVPDGTLLNVNFGNLTGVGNETLTLDIVKTAGTGSYFAIDNLTFDQVAIVPEPSSTALLGLGLGALAMRRKRK